MNESTQIRVLIVDDHDMVRKGLHVLLQNFDDLIVVGETGDGQAAVDFCRLTPVDVVLMDVVMPNVDGINAARQIRACCPKIRIIALTSFSEEQQVQRMLEAGAIGYLMKNINGDDLATAIRKAHVGQSTLASEAASMLINATTRPPALGHDLTGRERDVLALMIEGLNNREIGERLVISSSTVKIHVSSILSKLGSSGRTQAVALAVEHGILQ